MSLVGLDGICGDDEWATRDRSGQGPGQSTQRVGNSNADDMGRLPDREEYEAARGEETQGRGEVYHYIRRKRQTDTKEHVHGFCDKCCNLPKLKSRRKRVFCSMFCFFYCFAISALLISFAWVAASHVPAEGYHPGSWPSTTCTPTSVADYNAKCEAQPVWYWAMLDVNPKTKCCKVVVTYAYVDTSGTAGSITTADNVQIDWITDSTESCDTLVAGGTFECKYRQESPYQTVEHIDHYNDYEVAQDEMQAAVITYQVVGYALAAFYGIVLCLVMSYFVAFFCGCLPEFLEYYTMYFCNDCCGVDAEEEEEKAVAAESTVDVENGINPFSDGRSQDEYELVNPDDTRRILKKQYETAKEVIIGKQLACIALSEDFYHEVLEYVEGNPSLRAELRDENEPVYADMFHMLDELRLGMTAEEQDPAHNVLKEFQISLANHLVFHADLSDPAEKESVLAQLCVTGNVKYEEAEELFRQAVKLTQKVLANDLVASITDKDSERRAVQQVAAAGATWSQAARYISEARAGMHLMAEQQLGKRDYGIETIPLNRARRRKYTKLKDWWEHHLQGCEHRIRKNPALSTIVQSSENFEKLTGGLYNASNNLEESVSRDVADRGRFKKYIDQLNIQYEELRRLTDSFQDTQTRWAVYLKLSNSAVQIDNGKNKREVRQQVRHEMIMALGDILNMGIEDHSNGVSRQDAEDKDEIHKLLHEMETVDIQTDEYVHRLEDNLKEIAVAEQEQCEGLMEQIELQQKVANRMDMVNSAVKKNLDQLNRIIAFQQRIKYGAAVVLVCTVVTVCAIMFQVPLFGKRRT